MPHSWELVKQQQERLLIATCVPPGGISIDWALAFAALEKPPGWDFMRLTGLPWDCARTQAAYQMLNAGHQWLFFLDSDLLVPPNTITRLMSHRLPIVSALYHQRFPTWIGTEALYLPCLFNEGRDTQGNPVRQAITNFQYGQLVEAHYVPAGALLVHRSVFERMLAAGIKRFFEWTLTADNPVGRSEDFEACARWRAIGFKCFCDTGLQAIHETTGKVDVRGLSIKL